MTRFIDTKPNQCRWPVSGDNGPDMLVCGERVAADAWTAKARGDSKLATHCPDHFRTASADKARADKLLEGKKPGNRRRRSAA